MEPPHDHRLEGQARSSRRRYLPVSGPRRCPSCDAIVAEGLTWCGQCFAAVPTGDPTTASGLQARLRPQSAPIRDVVAAQRFSRWGASATSFGPVGRILLTIGLIIGLIVGFPMGLAGVELMVGSIPSQGFLALYLVLAVPAGIWCASRIWRSVRVA